MDFWQMIKVYSHPRSGTNFLLALIANNLYVDSDLSTPDGYIGHWSCREFVKGNRYGKLFGGHKLPNHYTVNKKKSVYIFRDGRDVAISLWRSENFKNKGWADISLSEFIRKPMDWLYTPARRYDGKMNIAQHWKTHLIEWKKSGVTLLRYENVLKNPHNALVVIARKDRRKLHSKIILPPLTGYHPNTGQANTWRDFFSEDDNKFFLDCVGKNFYGLYQ